MVWEVDAAGFRELVVGFTVVLNGGRVVEGDGFLVVTVVGCLLDAWVVVV